jgi:hypothetical protein
MEVVKWLKPSGSRPWRMSGSYALLTRRLSTPDGQRLDGHELPVANDSNRAAHLFSPPACR